MIGRVWDVNAVTGRYLSMDFVVSDSKGNMIHCSAKLSVAHNFLRMKEGGIYSVKNFVVLPNKDEFRIFRHDRFMIEFDGETSTRKVSADPHGFCRYPFRLIEFDQVEPAHNKYLIDIAGYVTNVGRTSYTKSGSKTLEFYLANQRGQSLRVTLWGELGDVLVEKKTKHAGVCAMVLTGMSGKEYNNKLYLSSTSSTVFYDDDDDIPCLQELRADDSRVAPSKAPLPIDCTQPREWTLENLLIWALNLQNNTTTFHCKVMIENFQTKKGWDYPSCGYEKCMKGASRKNGKWVCEACNRAVDYPVLRYRLEAVVADNTTHTVVVMFNDTATELLKCSAESLMGTEDEGSDADDDLNLPLAIRNLIGTTNVLEIKSHTYYEYDTFESFNYWKIMPSETAKDDASSSTPAVIANDVELSMKIVTKPPTVCTPLKPNEERKKRLEDSDVDEICGLLAKKGKSSADVAVDTKKKRKRVWDVNAVTGCYLSMDFVVSDSKGNMIHCNAKLSVAHNFLRMKEGGIYSVKNFVVLPNKDEFWIFRHDRFMIEFDGETSARKVSADPHGFCRYPFWLIEFDQVEPAHNKYLIDIAGYVTNVGRTSYTKSGSKTLEFYLANQRLALLTAYNSFVLQNYDGYGCYLMTQGQSLRVTLWGELSDVLVKKKTKHAGVCAMVLTGMSGKEYNNKLYLSSTSSMVFYDDDDDIPCLQELRADDSRVAPSKAPLPIDCTQPREGTLENLLIWALNLQNNTTTFHCKVMIENFQTKKGWNYPSCGYEKCMKGASRKNGKWVCEACNRVVDYPVFRYRLEAVVADDTAHTVVVMFNDTATELLKCSAESLIGTEDEGSDADDDLNLPLAIRNLIGTTHVLEIKSHTYYVYGTFESFKCRKINPSETAEDDASSSTPAVTANDAELSMKIVTKPPTVCTPLKPNEERKQKGHELEDSDVDEVCGPLAKTGKSSVDVVVDTKKKRKSKSELHNPYAIMNTGSHNNQRITPSFKGLLQNPVTIHANTIVGPDGRVQSTMNTVLHNNQSITLSLRDLLQNPVSTHVNIIIAQDGRIQSTMNIASCNNQIMTPSFTDLLQNSVRIHANIIIRQDGQVQSCQGDQQVQRICTRLKKGAKKAAFTSAGDTSAIGLGKRIVLPRTFTGSPRYMMNNYQDAMALCRAYGNPDLFITFTSNPKWPEISKMLAYFPGQKLHDRPEIWTRVFKIKLTELLHDLTQKHVFGESRAVVYVIEFQKRGLPHAHILLWLEEHSKCKTPGEVDDIISAEMPFLMADPDGYKVVTDYMLQRPCGKDARKAACTSDGKCSKHFPKPFLVETFLDEDGYPHYRRRDNKVTFKKGNFIYDNKHVVPHNRYLLLKYKAHINVEWCNRSKAIKYLFKYLNKGPDRAIIVIEENVKNGTTAGTENVLEVDEIKNYLNCRFLAPCEAVWRLFLFDIHYTYPSVMQLSFHLPNQNVITLRDSERLPALLQREGIDVTMFTDWFELNKRDPDARTLTYADIPKHYVWHEQREHYYLRMLLNVVRGVSGFEELMTVNKRVCATFKEACFGYGLPHDDKEWSYIIAEASLWALGPQLRDIFVTMLIFCDVSRPLKLWEESWQTLSKDILAKKRKLFKYPNLQLTDEQIKNYCLIEIKELLHKYGRSLADFKDLPQPDLKLLTNIDNHLIREALDFDIKKSRAEHQHLHSFMRVNEYSANGADDKAKQEFNRRVLVVGDGTLLAKMKEGEDEPTWIGIPEKFLIKTWDCPIRKIVEEIYPDFTSRQTNDEYLKERAILTPRNDDADAINEFMFK
ncbi:uncharacterized protein Tco_1042840 [Tanacetum coccineum]|uniref:ATP-dependent DNA helicase n=1 Tax=Tanacetum coccineum TaxID=301880 RepID=A0ABQ5GKB2_9ASTR